MSADVLTPEDARVRPDHRSGDLPLEVVEVGMRFGGTVALEKVSLVVRSGERVGLIGPNGAGKTTLLAIISGSLHPSAGRVLRHGRDMTRVTAEARARSGMGRTFQHSSRFTALTAAESVAVAILAHRRDHPFLRGLIGRGRVLQTALEQAQALLGELGVEQYSATPAADLPLGISRLVDVARAISGKPDLLLLDEPSSGLDERERDGLRSFLDHHVSERGMAFVLVEHDVEFVQSLCERLVVLDFGVKIADAATGRALSDPAVRSAYLGHEDGAPGSVLAGRPEPAISAPAAGTASAAHPGRVETDAPTLEMKGVTAGYGRSQVLNGISLSVPRGTALAVLGPNGAGKTTLARVITGQLRPTAGQLRLHGREIGGLPTASIARMGVFHVPDSRAIYPSLNVRENLSMAFRHRMDGRRINDGIERVMELFPALARHLNTRAGTLSGGEQQMLALATAIAEPPEVLVLDELSHGLSPLIVGQLFDVLATLKGTVTTVVIEQFTDRALGLADHVVALRRGGVVFDGPVTRVTPEEVASWYALEEGERSA